MCNTVYHSDPAEWCLLALSACWTVSHIPWCNTPVGRELSIIYLLNFPYFVTCDLEGPTQVPDLLAPINCGIDQMKLLTFLIFV